MQVTTRLVQISCQLCVQEKQDLGFTKGQLANCMEVLCSLLNPFTPELNKCILPTFQKAIVKSE